MNQFSLPEEASCCIQDAILLLFDNRYCYRKQLQGCVPQVPDISFMCTKRVTDDLWYRYQLLWYQVPPKPKVLAPPMLILGNGETYNENNTI